MRKLFLIIATVIFCMQSMPVRSATFDKSDYKRLVQIAYQKGFVRVLIGLDVNVSLADLGKRSPALKRQLAEQERAVLNELGDTASTSGRWRSGIGQLEVYVTAEGLKRLVKSRYVRKLMSTTTDSLRLTFHDDTGTHIDDVEAEIDKKGFAEVEVVLNLENLAYDYMPNGETKFKDSPELTKEMHAKLPLFLGSLMPKHVHNSANREKSSNLKNKPVQLLHIDREGLFALREHKDIRALRLVNNAPPKVPQFDKDVLETAKAKGSAGVFISLYQPFGYSPQVGRLSARAWRSQATTLKETFNNLFLALGTGAVKEVQAFEGVPNIYAVLSYAALQQLYKSPDARIKSIKLNKVAVGPLLNESTAFINMPYAWNHNPQYRGAGQQIVIMDSAFQKNHPFLQQSNGQSKVVFEACFGTTGTVTNPINGNSETFTSLCPLADQVTGDSPLGMVNSADSSICSQDDDCKNLCCHGTYVSGIAAGKYAWLTTRPQWPYNNLMLTGMAPDATIIGVSIMSKQTEMNDAPLMRLWGTYLDLDQAMVTLANVASGSVGMGNITTVSLSVGGGIVPAGDCPNQDDAFYWAVEMLHSINIPVVAATGNDGSNSAILWPACTPKVIKVAGTILNNGNEAFWRGSNIINPATTTSPILLAPACVVSSGINSGLAGGHADPYCGTSASTPHVAGLYALIKQAVPGITVDQATAWILDYASTPVQTGYGYAVQSIKLPPL